MSEADTTETAETPEETAEAVEAQNDHGVNTTGASEIQQVTASQTLAGDPRVAQDAAEQNMGEGKYDGLDLVELRQELTERGLPKTGNKADLIARLKAADVQGQPDQSSVVTPGAEAQRAVETNGQPTVGADPGGSEGGAPVVSELEGGVREKTAEKAVAALTAVENGGLVRTDAGEVHTDLLQQMSADRRAAQLAATKKS